MQWIHKSMFPDVELSVKTQIYIFSASESTDGGNSKENN